MLQPTFHLLSMLLPTATDITTMHAPALWESPVAAALLSCLQWVQSAPLYQAAVICTKSPTMLAVKACTTVPFLLA